MKNILTSLIASHERKIDGLLSICQKVGVTHWVHLMSANQVRNHCRKNGIPNIAILSERIGTEYGINLSQELRNIGCENILLFMRKKDSNSLNRILKKGIRTLVFNDDVISSKPDWKLTQKEIQVIKFLANGQNLQEIAASLQTTISVVKNILGKIRKKTGIHERAAIITSALRAGVIG